MTRHEAIARIQSKLAALPDEQLEALAEMLSGPSPVTLYAALTAEERRELDEGVDSLDRGERIDLDEVERRLDARLKAADR